jgi:nucleotide-binding universal stress UspA family protein
MNVPAPNYQSLGYDRIFVAVDGTPQQELVIQRAIIIAANNGWVEGYNGLFRPDDYITRAEAMTLVNRVLHRLPETEHDLLEYMVIWPDNMDVNAWYYLAVQEATNSHDYNRKPNPVFETWTEFMEPYDWSLLEY